MIAWPEDRVASLNYDTALEGGLKARGHCIPGYQAARIKQIYRVSCLGQQPMFLYFSSRMLAFAVPGNNQAGDIVPVLLPKSALAAYAANADADIRWSIIRQLAKPITSKLTEYGFRFDVDIRPRFTNLVVLHWLHIAEGLGTLLLVSPRVVIARSQWKPQL